jgi:hypothetical protein
MATKKDVHSSVELYKLLSKEYLHLRSGDGRDDALIRQLATRLGLDPNKTIPKQLEANKVSLEEFIQELFVLTEPFSKMYSEIFALIQSQNVQASANSSIRMRFCFEKATKKLEFDLKHFREWLKIYQKFQGEFFVKLWTQEDINKLYQPIGELQKILGEGSDSGINTHYPCPLPDPALYGTNANWKPVKLLRNAMEQLRQAQTQEKVIVNTEVISILREKQNVEDRKDPDQTESKVNLTDIWPGLFRLLLQLEKTSTVTPSAAMDSLGKISATMNDVTSTRVKGNLLIQKFVELLRLPFWKYRWRLYEVWTLFKLIECLNEYDCKLEDKNGKIELEENKASVVAHFTDSNLVTYSVWTQLKTNVADPLKRKHIMPDIRVCKLDASLPENSFLVLECKQRKQMKTRELKELVKDYLAGAENSELVLFVNYDEFPIISKFPKTVLISKLHPTNPEAIAEFNGVIKKGLVDCGINPSTSQIDAILFDVSDSMRGQYLRNEIGEACQQIIFKNPKGKIFFFNDCLLSTEQLSTIDLKGRLEGMIRGGTDLDASLREIAKKYPKIKRLVVVTDGGYNRSLTSIGSYESVEQLVIGENFP